MSKSRAEQEIQKQIEEVRAALVTVVESTHGTPKRPIDKLECSSVKLAILQRLQNELIIEQMFVEGELRALESGEKTP